MGRASTSDLRCGKRTHSVSTPPLPPPPEAWVVRDSKGVVVNSPSLQRGGARVMQVMASRTSTRFVQHVELCCTWVSLRANASRDFGLLNMARSERCEWRAQAFCIVMQAAPAARRITAWASQPVQVHRDRSRHTRGLRLLPAITYSLRVQTGGREAQERPMTA